MTNQYRAWPSRTRPSLVVNPNIVDCPEVATELAGQVLGYSAVAPNSEFWKSLGQAAIVPGHGDFASDATAYIFSRQRRFPTLTCLDVDRRTVAKWFLTCDQQPKRVGRLLITAPKYADLVIGRSVDSQLRQLGHAGDFDGLSQEMLNYLRFCRDVAGSGAADQIAGTAIDLLPRNVLMADGYQVIDNEFEFLGDLPLAYLAYRACYSVVPHLPDPVPPEYGVLRLVTSLCARLGVTFDLAQVLELERQFLLAAWPFHLRLATTSPALYRLLRVAQLRRY